MLHSVSKINLKQVENAVQGILHKRIKFFILHRSDNYEFFVKTKLNVMLLRY